MAKRIFGLFLALCLVVGLLPMIALAAEEKPTPPATLVVTTGTNTDRIQFTPEMSQGMTPAYAKTTAEGNLVLEGASETDYNLKAEWPADGKPTLILKNATLNNNSMYVAASEAADGVAVPLVHTIAIGGTEDFVVLVKGTNTINGNHDKKPTTTAEYRRPRGIEAKNLGTLTIKGDSKADKLTIDNYSGSIMGKWYNALIFENMTFYAEMHQTKSNAQFGILLYYGKTEHADKTNMTVLNCDFTMECGPDYSTRAITMCGDKLGLSTANTGDILFKNSKVRLYRNNGTGTEGDSSTLIYFGEKSTLTFDRCDVLVYARHRTMSYWPTMTNVDVVSAGDMVLPAGKKVNSSTLPKLQLTHQCGTEGNGDCTKEQTCDVCGKTVAPAQTAHVAAADDGDCTTAILCKNAGCKVVVTEAKASHEAAADDGDCTTAVLCKNTGCKKVMVEAKPSHTSPASRTDCSQASACAVCNKALAAGEHTGGAATCLAKKKCELCNEEYGELGAHVGGTATCKDKAVCTVCNKPYGELSTVHTPAEDDGDCTTAIKCTVCDAEQVAAKTHTFTDAKDTTCDNAGCKHTRTITSNPNSGDISILLTAAVALSSAVGFAGVTALRKKEN